MELRHKYEIGVGLLFLLGIITLGYMAIRIGGVHRFGPQEQYYVDIVDATGLVQNGAVMVSGVEIGYIEEVKVDPLNNHAHVEISVRSDLNLRKNASAIVRAKSLLGEKFLDLIPGTPEFDILPPGAIITDSASLISIDQFVDDIKTDVLGKVDPEMVNGLLSIAYNSLKGHEEDIGDTIRSVRNILVKVDEEMNTPDGDLDRMFTSIGSVAQIFSSMSAADREEVMTAIRKVNSIINFMAAAAPKLDRNLERIDSLAAMPGLDAQRVVDLVDKTDNLLDASSVLLANFRGVDFEDLKRMLQDEGITFSFSDRSDELRQQDRERFDTAPD